MKSKCERALELVRGGKSKAQACKLIGIKNPSQLSRYIRMNEPELLSYHGQGRPKCSVDIRDIIREQIQLLTDKTAELTAELEKTNRELASNQAALAALGDGSDANA